MFFHLNLGLLSSYGGQITKGLLQKNGSTLPEQEKSTEICNKKVHSMKRW